MAGVPNTDATWWAIMDDASVKIARDFYLGLEDGKGGIDMRRTAVSLRGVTANLRSEGLGPMNWAAYVHRV
jgi:CHAT domain-containing protein